MDEIEEWDDVDYLEETTLDSDRWIFRNLHGKFLTKSSIFSPRTQTVKMNLQKPFL